MNTRNTFKARLPQTFPLFLTAHTPEKRAQHQGSDPLPGVLFMTTYPPRECGIATYSQDLMRAIAKQFIHSFSIEVAALESHQEKHSYPDKNVKYVLNTSSSESYQKFLSRINRDIKTQLIVIQHEFGLFAENVKAFNDFLVNVKKPLVVVFHTVLVPGDETFRANVQHILNHVAGVVVMSRDAARILETHYSIPADNIHVIAHGTHLVPHKDKKLLKQQYNVGRRTVLSTFGLLSSGKSIETTIEALPAIVKKCPDVLFLIIGKTHPTVALQEGESYRHSLVQKIAGLGMENHVRFVNEYVSLEKLLDYLQLTDIYLFTSKDPNQAVSGTFSYALSCGCPVVSTPIPHAREFLEKQAGLVFDFGNAEALALAVNRLIADKELRRRMSLNALHQIAGTAWENSAVQHGKLFQKIIGQKLELHYRNPELNLEHLKKMTTGFGMLQFSKLNHPDLYSDFTLDDNARALIAFCQYYKQSRDASILKYINIYLKFIAFCEQKDQLFLNYVDLGQNFTAQNDEVNLEDATGRALWALGYVVSLTGVLPSATTALAQQIFDRAIPHVHNILSPRAMAFIIKGIYYYARYSKTPDNTALTGLFANRLADKFRDESDVEWHWFEHYMTYANSILPEAMLCAYELCGQHRYKDIAVKSFDFLLSKTFLDSGIRVISNRSWHFKGETTEVYGEQPIDVAYTILALRKFHDVLKINDYLVKMEIAFSWFLGNNHLQQTIYNPCTGGCYDGLEQYTVNLNQGAESSVSYLMARLTVGKYFGHENQMYHRSPPRLQRQTIVN